MTTETLVATIKKAALRAVKENLARNTEVILSRDEESVLDIGITSGAKAMLSTLRDLGALKDPKDWLQ